MTTPSTAGPAKAAILVARSAFTGASSSEIETLAQQLLGHAGIETVRFAFTEQGEPPLKEVVREVVGLGIAELLILPLMVPIEPGHRLWLGRSLRRWRSADADRVWPILRIGPAPAQVPGLLSMAQELLGAALAADELADEAVTPPEGSQVPLQKHRVLVCLGGPCNNAGGMAVWGHLRNEQKRRGLATQGGGVVSAKTSCLGPCGLAPVVQVYPEGTLYGAVDEAGMDRIIDEHLLGGRVVESLAYPPIKGRQHARPRSTSADGAEGDSNPNRRML